MLKRTVAVIPWTRVAMVSFRIFARGWFWRSVGGRKPVPDHHGYKAAQVLTCVIAFDIKGAICRLTQTVVVLTATTSHFQSFRAIRTYCCCYQSLSTIFFTSSKVLLSWVQPKATNWVN